MKNNLNGFDNTLYIDAQCEAFDARINSDDSAEKVIEFGGKPFGDYHAARVLPGYDKDVKAEVLKYLSDEAGAKLVMVVNSRDILEQPSGRTIHGRIRGDSGFRYEDETIRLIGQAKNEFGLNVEAIALANVPLKLTDGDNEHIADFVVKANDETGLNIGNYYEIPGYPSLDSIMGREAFDRNARQHSYGRPTVLLSPGGGSGKFGVGLSEMYHILQGNGSVDFIKFETFPAFGLSPQHPVNLAFEAATADLGNVVMLGADGCTTYDKDDENYKLLQGLGALFPANASNMAEVESPSAFSVNAIERGILDEEIVAKSALAEIIRRLDRYKGECLRGDEKLSTVTRCAHILGIAATSNLQMQEED